MMSLFWIIAVILVAGVLLWGFNSLPGIDPALKQIARVLVIVVVLIMVLYFLFGMFAGGAPFHGFAGPCR